jgi:hypothetical protein
MRITASWSGSSPTEYKDVARIFVHHTRAPLGLHHPDHNKCAVVLEAVKDEAYGGADAPSLTAPARAGSSIA